METRKRMKYIIEALFTISSRSPRMAAHFRQSLLWILGECIRYLYVRIRFDHFSIFSLVTSRTTKLTSGHSTCKGSEQPECRNHVKAGFNSLRSCAEEPKHVLRRALLEHGVGVGAATSLLRNMLDN